MNFYFVLLGGASKVRGRGRPVRARARTTCQTMRSLHRILAPLAMSSAIRFSPHPFPRMLHQGGSVSSNFLSSKRNIVDLAFVESHGRSLETDVDAPATLFIHGLDSSSHTWRSVQKSLPYYSVSVDCRGCGRSDLGDPDHFSPEALVADIKAFVDSHPMLQQQGKKGRKKKFVLAGHSMGGRLAMAYAATHPGDLAALIIEDMDMRRRSIDSNFLLPKFNDSRAIAFNRWQSSLASAKQTLGEVGYPFDMVDKWIDEGRIYEVQEEDEVGETDSTWWSDVNPAFRSLCYQTVFDSDNGENSWNQIIRHLKGDYTFSIHLMVAGIGTVCDESNIEEMVNSIGTDQVKAKIYLEGTHSIHNSMKEEFVEDLKKIVRDAAESMKNVPK